jgi:hypothetical protein
MMKRAVLPIALAMAFAPAPLAHADGNWVAMAISDSTGRIKFTSGGATEDAAQQAAMQACRKSISDCRLLASGPGGCVAIANAANRKYVGGWGPTRDEAEAAALATSQGGNVLKDHTHCEGDGAS